ncbi:MAG: 16S rRNA (cytosine(1402)-N(4))-methyltransferase RsmH [Oscillospiraceae bacterium]|nr:16S rRNA (cytosine(1402)-N(4))-methyltransferase RsmH [Oscillospiraceae bacterium]
MDFKHTTVLCKETIETLDIKPGELYIDCTSGGGGHSFEIAKKGGRLICFDVDANAIAACRERVRGYQDVELINANFADMADYINTGAAGVLMDLGVSSHQLDVAERGFSFHEDAPLDMRMSAVSETYSAFDVVNGYSEERLIKILYEYGEEKYAKGIVRGIIAARQAAPVETTGQLAEIIKRNVPLSVRNAKNPCRKTFQAIRIEVNDELGSLSRGLNAGFGILSHGGRLAVITFHSLEDRLVKKQFSEWTAGCDCPKNLPLCVCGKLPSAIHITRKPIVPGASELNSNRRARSAKLRVVQKVIQEGE